MIGGGAVGVGGVGMVGGTGMVRGVGGGAAMGGAGMVGGGVVPAGGMIAAGGGVVPAGGMIAGGGVVPAAGMTIATGGGGECCTGGGCTGAGVAPGCAGACLGMEAACCTAEGAINSVQWRFVGQGSGRYDALQSYNFVGQGMGSWEPQTVSMPYGWRLRPACIVCSLLVVVVVVMAIFVQPPVTSTTTPFTTTPVPLPPASCVMWGDPHFETFDHGFPNFYDEGEFWVVRSNDVQIQGRYLATPFTNGLSATNSIIVGGRFLGGHTITVGPMEDGQILFDHSPIMQQMPSTFALPAGLGSLAYNGNGQLVDGGMAGAGLEKHIVHMNLPKGVHLQVMRWANHLNVKITMSPEPGMDGGCGNFNGNAADDSTQSILGRMGNFARVAPQELLFHSRAQVSGTHQTKSLADCPAQKKARAAQLCHGAAPHETGVALSDCEFDVCFGGEQYAKEDGLSED